MDSEPPRRAESKEATPYSSSKGLRLSTMCANPPRRRSSTDIWMPFILGHCWSAAASKWERPQWNYFSCFAIIYFRSIAFNHIFACYSCLNKWKHLSAVNDCAFLWEVSFSWRQSHIWFFLYVTQQTEVIESWKKACLSYQDPRDTGLRHQSERTEVTCCFCSDAPCYPVLRSHLWHLLPEFIPNEHDAIPQGITQGKELVTPTQTSLIFYIFHLFCDW